ncbi:MAG TPA: TlpA disulfide reductase family protein [Bacteroidota bacterium]|nr:TlpA disulfide reductase family protein [Bacteroidota bacterium]
MKTRFEHLAIVLVVVLLPALVGCGRSAPVRATWSGHLILANDRPLPFRMFLDRSTSTGYFLNGSEKTEIPEVQSSGDSLVLVFSEYSAEMAGVIKGETWNGQYIRFRSDTTSIPFFANVEPAEGEPAGASPSPPGVSLVGRFRAYITNRNSVDSSNVGTFWLKGDSIQGTLIAPDGDEGLLAGRQAGSHVELARFNGWQATLLELDGSGADWTGQLYFRRQPPIDVRLVAQPSSSWEAPPGQQTTAKYPKAPFQFEGISTSGRILKSSDEVFRNKVVLVDIMGTWCHNCLDEAPILQQLYAEFKEKGLEVVGLSFEINGDSAFARKNLSQYGQRFQLSFPLLFCGSLAEKNVDAKLQSQLNNFYAYPTAILLDRKGRIRHIHVGFRGPGTGEEYQREVSEMHRIVKQLVEAK